VSAALQGYADRGVFRGFRAAAGSRGRMEYQFLWLTRRPTRAVFDPRRNTLSFPALFPGITAAADLRSIVAARSARRQPRHKRIDARRARLSSRMRAGDFSLTVEIRGRHAGYAVSQALNVINELHLALHEARPEYLIERFGVSAE
jgi:hypothetical protein